MGIILPDYFEQIPSNVCRVMALCTFCHFKIVSKISQSIWARELKLGQLIEDDEYIT